MKLTIDEFASRLVNNAIFAPRGRSYDAVDCWGVIYLYYRDVDGREVPSYVNDYRERDVLGTSALAQLIDRNRGGWRRSSDWRAGDVTLFLIDRRPVHIGLMIDPLRVLHAESEHGVFVERVDTPLWRHRLEGVYRRV